ncbi:MAG TPA: carboxysome shell carbonic anhydrase [Gammaproteobacteria bacterium]|nr:carboxysome shell carbonic anhydrase [Gammaproteobacteria bacterium]
MATGRQRNSRSSTRRLASAPRRGGSLGRPAEVRPQREGESSGDGHWLRSREPARPRPATRGGSEHALVSVRDNERLLEHETEVKAAFDRIEPFLRRLSAMQHEAGFVDRAQGMARSELGFELPQQVLEDAWIQQLDIRYLFAWCVFETYRAYADDFYRREPLAPDPAEADRFQAWLQECGFHAVDISPCSDGRLAHVIRYVLRLPHGLVRRKSFAGAMFDVEASLKRWVETELGRFREGVPNTADAPTRYLKLAVYHYSSSDPEHQGCAAHGSDTEKAAAAARDRLQDFQQAIENSFCCGASIDLLLVGLDTDTDAIRVHPPDGGGDPDPGRFVDAETLFDETTGLGAEAARERVEERVAAEAGGSEPGMRRFVAGLVENNFAQIAYVRAHHNGRYADIGHNERFMGVGMGFEEVQLRNLTYFAYLQTVEEGAPDLDVGVKIFSGLNAGRGLPVPVVLRFDYHGQVPGARERAEARTRRVAEALCNRYPKLAEQGLLHTLMAVRDCGNNGTLEVIGSSLEPTGTGDTH